MRAWIAFVAAAIVVGAGCGGGSDQASIVFSGFGGKGDESAAKFFFGPFQAETGVAVRRDASSENIVAKLRAAAKAGQVPWSLIRVEEEDAVVLEQDGLIQPLPADVKRRLEKHSYDGGVTAYGVAYVDYSSVLVCNRKLAARCPTTPAEFWDTERFPGPRTMYAEGWLEGLVLALEADGVPRGQLFPLDLDRAFRSLDRIKPAIDVWWQTSEQSQQMLLDGEVAMGYIWSGRAALLADDPRFRISFDGAVRTRELLVVPKGAPNADAGFALMEWYASHPRAEAGFVAERRNGLVNPKLLAYLPTKVAASISTAPANAAASVPIDFGWVTTERDTAFRRWQEWLSG